MKSKLISMIFFVLLVGCSPSVEQVQELVEKTKRAQLTQTAKYVADDQVAILPETQTPTPAPTHSPTFEPTLTFTELPMFTPETIRGGQESLFFPDSYEMSFSEFESLNSNFDTQKVLLVPCEVVDKDLSTLGCVWPSAGSSLYIVKMKETINNLQNGDVIYVFCKYIQEVKAEGYDQELVQIFDGLHYQKDIEEFAYEPVVSDLEYSSEMHESIYEDQESLGLIPYNFILFPDNFYGRYVKLPCTVSEVFEEGVVFCVWGEAGKEYLINSRDFSFSELQFTDRLTIFGFVDSDFICFDNIGAPSIEKNCVPIINLTSYYKNSN